MSFQKNNWNVYFHSLIRVYQTNQFETSSNNKKIKKSPVIIHRCLRPLFTPNWHSAAVRRGKVARPVAVFFCRRGGTSNPLHGNDSDSRYELATPRGILELNWSSSASDRADGWWVMMDDGWWQGGWLIYVVFKRDVENICWNMVERKVRGNSKWQKTCSPIVSGSQANLRKGHWVFMLQQEQKSGQKNYPTWFQHEMLPVIIRQKNPTNTKNIYY